MSVLLILFILLLLIILVNPYVKFNKKNFNKEIYSQLRIPIVSFKSGDNTLCFLVDTGSNNNHLTSSALDKVIKESINHDKCVISAACGQTEAEGYYNVQLNDGKSKFEDIFEIMDLDDTFKSWGLTLDGIIGTSFLRKYNFKVDFNSMSIYV